jgi:hypothetical protein
MVLHAITNNAKLVKVAASSMSSERLLEGEHDTLNVSFAPRLFKPSIGETKSSTVLYHVFSKEICFREKGAFWCEKEKK